MYNNSRTTSTGVTPEGIPGFKADLCEYCAYDAEQAQTLFDEWKAEGNELTEPLPLQFNADAGHEPVAAIVVDNLAAIGIEAVAQPDERRDLLLRSRRRWLHRDVPGRLVRRLPDVRQLHVRPVRTPTPSVATTTDTYSNEEFDALVDEGKQTVDPDEQAALFQEAEKILLNEDTGVVPMNWYLGDYVYSDDIANFPQTNFGLILWEQVAFAE